MEDDDETPASFSLSSSDLQMLQEVAGIIRGQLKQAEPAFIKAAAVSLLVLERLPAPVPGAVVTIGWLNDGGDGNKEWTHLSISEEEMTASDGAHFYEPGVGGDTETNDVFKAFVGGGRSGSLEIWFEQAQHMANVGWLNVDAGDTDFDRIDWQGD